MFRHKSSVYIVQSYRFVAGLGGPEQPRDMQDRAAFSLACRQPRDMQDRAACSYPLDWRHLVWHTAQMYSREWG
jgi:hypothetical protein